MSIKKSSAQSIKKKQPMVAATESEAMKQQVDDGGSNYSQRTWISKEKS